MTKTAVEVNRFSAQKFTSRADMEFSIKKYSKFKFGCRDTARLFGEELGKKFCQSATFKAIVELSKAQDKRIFILSSPYIFVPTATFAMKDYFVKVLNHYLYLNKAKPCIETKVSRAKSYGNDYGEMNAAERDEIMKDEVFHCDAALINNHICLFLDDIIITGSHERRMLRMIERHNLDICANFLYFAELTNAEQHPNIENELNYAYVKGLLDINKIIANNNFKMNTRVVKYILNAPHSECAYFLDYQKQAFINELYANAIGNSYHLIPQYDMNFKYLRTKIDKI